MSYDNDLRQLQQSAERQGWRVNRTTRGHIQFYAPNKHDIITFAGTPGDVRGFTNSLAQMKKAGYVDYNDNKAPATTNLGSLLVAAAPKDQVIQHSPNLKQRTVPSLIIEYLEKHPTRGVPLDEVILAVRVHRPTASEMQIKQETSRLATEDRIRRVGRGVYASKYLLVAPTEKEQEETPPPAPTPEPTPVVITPPAPTTDDNDIEELDAALVALARIESVVRKYKEVSRQFKALKAMLNSMGAA